MRRYIKATYDDEAQSMIPANVGVSRGTECSPTSETEGQGKAWQV